MRSLLPILVLGAMADVCGAQTRPAHEDGASRRFDETERNAGRSGELGPVLLAERRGGNLPKSRDMADYIAVKSPVTEHHFYDRYAKIELAGAGSLAVADTVITCRFLARGQREMNRQIQSCGGMVGFQFAIYGAGEGLSFLLHKTGHHKLERLPRLYLGFGNAQGIVFSARHGGI